MCVRLSEPVKIRIAVLEDADPILALYTEAAGHVNPVDYLPQQAIDWLAKRHSERIHELISEGRVLVALGDDGELLGFASRFGAEIHGLCVAVYHLRKGIGTALLARLKTDARDEGFTELIAKSLIATEPFFRKTGFVEVERKKWPLSSGISIEVVVMKKTI